MPDYRTSRSAPRRSYTKEKKKELADRVIGFYRDDLQNKSAEIDLRLQRYAKLRGWTEGKSFPWPDSSDVAIADIMTASLRIQDTIHNAVMSAVPVVKAQATDPSDRPKEEYVDALIDFQVFTEQAGETTISGLAQAFVEDGAFTAEVSWCRDIRRGTEIRKFPPLPADALPGRLFQAQVEALKPQRMQVVEGSEGWDWGVTLSDGSNAQVHFYATAGEPTEMHIDRQMSIFNGPLIDRHSWDDVFYPVRCENLQIKSASNKRGASHVIIRTAPTIDDIERMVKLKFYDQVGADELDEIKLGRKSGGDEEAKDQRDALAGKQNQPGPPAAAASKSDDGKPSGAEAHTELTLLRCFDVYDIDDDGQTEDIVCWVIAETGHLLKCALLSEVYPYFPTRRPFARQVFLPLDGSADGISLPELMEGYHDLNKVLMDQTVDINTITGVPFFFYRAAGGNRPEIIKSAPGEGYPLADPQKDVNFPRMNTSGVAGGLNLIALTTQWQERLTNIGDLQLGRVPVGRASALRTVGGMSMVAQQGEARPERILRRFFLGLADIYAMIHQLNQVHIDKGKQVRLRAIRSKDDDPYKEVKGSDIRMQAIFTFTANAYNASKAALQEGLDKAAAMFVNPLAIQMGTITPDGFYRFQRHYAQAHGITDIADDVLQPPSADAMKPKLLFEEVLHAIMTNQGVPDCAPHEFGGAQEQYAKFISYVQSREVGLLTEEQAQQLRAYAARLVEMVRVQMAQQRMAAAAEAFAGSRSPGAGGGGISPETAAGAMAGPPQISGPNELIDESLPSAGGGGNPEPVT